MTKLDRLLTELCPDGMEYREFGELATIQRGGSPRPIQQFITNDPNGINWIKIGDVAPGGKYITSTKEKIIREGMSKSRFVKPGDFVLSNSMSFGRPYILQIEGCIHDGWLAISNFAEYFIPDFLYHLLGSNIIQKTMAQRASSGTVSNLNAEIVRSIELPIPPLDVQREIVRILDNFTELTAELTAELTTRKKQYNYYRDELLAFGDDVPMVTLGEIARISNGKDHKHMGEGQIPVYGSGGIMRYADESIYNEVSVLIPRKGSIGNVFYVDVPFWTVDTIFYTKINNEKMIPKFLYYYLLTQHLEELNTAGGVPSLTKAVLDKVFIPLPSLDEQARIVLILDRFDALTTGITNGLPAEIAARQKQYEYYRDKLLTFTEVGA